MVGRALTETNQHLWMSFDLSKFLFCTNMELRVQPILNNINPLEKINFLDFEMNQLK